MRSHELAEQLFNLADHLRKQADTEIGEIEVGNHCSLTKANIIALAQVMPRPMSKRYSDYFFSLEAKAANGFPQLGFSASRDSVCKIVKPAQPAVYDCDPLFTVDEEAVL